MSRSDWLRYGAIGAVILLFIGGAFWWALDAYQQNQAQQREQVAPRAADPSQQEAREACHDVTDLAAHTKCIAEKQKTQREEWRAQYDLQAQQQMALWAYALFASGIIGLVITGAGVVYVALTLRATRESLQVANRSADLAEDALQDARMNAQCELRAYVGCIGCFVEGFDGLAPHLAVNIQNQGQTPAYKVTLAMDSRFSEKPIEGPLYVQRVSLITSLGVLGPQTSVGSTKRIEPTLTATQKEAIKDGKAQIYGFGRITYKDAFGKTRYTQFKAMLGGGAPTSKSYDMVICEQGNEAN